MSGWIHVDPQRAATLRDARVQLHHAVQFATAAGISYLTARTDDSHTNLKWMDHAGALASNPIPVGDGSVRVAIRMRDLTLLVMRDSKTATELPLRGRTIPDATTWARDQLGSAGLDGRAYTLKRHFEIPAHGVADGAAFSALEADLIQIAAWFANAVVALTAVRDANPDASQVRCWPHHFDIAALITVSPTASVGMGLEPGDAYYQEPYFYLNAYPQPSADRLPQTLDGKGAWHTHEWIGAVLPGSRLASDASQEGQVNAFLRSAVAACRLLVAGR